jgi:hypothetical protein
MNDPLPVVSHELVPERVRLNTSDKTLHIVFLVEAIDSSDIELEVFLDVDFPKFHVAAQLSLKLFCKRLTRLRMKVIGRRRPNVVK